MKTPEEWEQMAPISNGEKTTKFIRAVQEDAIEDLVRALDASVRLQSHYANLLNQWDGGERRCFQDGAEWIARLRSMEEKKGRTTQSGQ